MKNTIGILSFGLILLLVLPFAAACEKNDSGGGHGGLPDVPAKGEDQALALSSDLADTWMRTYEPSQNAWSWDAGILMMGFMALSDAVQKNEYSDYARAWLDHYIDSGYHVSSSDTCVPGYTALLFYEKTGRKKYLDVAKRVWSYIREKAGRTRDGGLNHMGWISGNQIWVDTLFMVGPFLLKYAEITGSADALDEFALQLQVFRKHLQDPREGLYLHRYDDDTGEVLPAEPLFWGRGNGWVFAASNLAYNAFPDSVLAGMDFDLPADIERMSEKISAYEDASGRFHTVLNRSDTYLETSAGLLYAWGLCIGMQDKRLFPKTRLPEAERRLRAATDRIVVDETGDTLLLGTSYGTSPGGVEYYNQVLKGENVAYGMGLYMLLAVERERVGHGSAIRKTDGPAREPYIHPPMPCEGTPCGAFHLARGNFTRAREDFEDALDSDPSNAQAAFYISVIDLVRLAVGAVSRIDGLFIGDENFSDLLVWLSSDARPAVESIRASLEIAERDQAFSSVLPRLVIIESGGHNALGAREFDLGEVYLIGGLANLADGLLILIDEGGPQAMDRLVLGLDKLIAGIESIEAETDDQSNDLLPKNLFALTGTFSLPGILPPTSVRDLALSLGIPETLLDMLDMPKDLLRLLRWIKGLLE